MTGLSLTVPGIGKMLFVDFFYFCFSSLDCQGCHIACLAQPLFSYNRIERNRMSPYEIWKNPNDILFFFVGEVCVPAYLCMHMYASC